RFLGLKMEEVSPDHSTISRFRSALTELGLMDKLLAQFNKQLSRHHISVREGVLVNASLVEIRSTIERTFGSIRRWFHGGRCRYRGLAKTHTQNILESIAFNL
ncbi:IS5/IS1182 family transposase, partial [Porphyromonas gingivalis]